MQTIYAKTIVSAYSECGWFGSNYTMNIYKGCCHGCIYCDSRSECYHVENFDIVRAKENALQIVEQDLKSKRKKGIIISGSMSDAYNPFEEKECLMRGALKLIDEYGFGIVIDTKSDLVVRDLDILKMIKEHSPAVVNVTITTAADELCTKIEQHVCPTSRRIQAIKTLSSNGIMCGVLLMPILPHINDTEKNITAIVRMAADAGARWIFAGDSFGVTLRQNQREYYFQKLDSLFPNMKQEYMKEYGNQYYCMSPRSNELWSVFKRECEKYGLLYRMMDIEQCIKSNYEYEQLSLF